MAAIFYLFDHTEALGLLKRAIQNWLFYTPHINQLSSRISVIKHLMFHAPFSAVWRRLSHRNALHRVSWYPAQLAQLLSGYWGPWGAVSLVCGVGGFVCASEVAGSGVINRLEGEELLGNGGVAGGLTVCIWIDSALPDYQTRLSMVVPTDYPVAD